MATRSHQLLDSPIGPMTLVGEDGAVIGLYWDRHRRRAPLPDLGERVETGFEDVRAQLAEYFAGTRTSFDVPITLLGDAFQRDVWSLLLEISYGQTRTYGELARDLGNPGLAQAVGAANGANPISIIVPCHRVIGAGGKLTGYAGGLERKRFLLELEEPPEVRESRLW